MTKPAPEALWWPQNLDYYNYLDRVDCYLETELPDYSVGWNGACRLIHAYAGGVDITDLLDETIIKTIEGLAWSTLSSS